MSSNRPFIRPSTTGHGRYYVALPFATAPSADGQDALAERLETATIDIRGGRDQDEIPTEQVTVSGAGALVTLAGTLEHPLTGYSSTLSQTVAEWRRVHGPLTAPVRAGGGIRSGVLTADVLEVPGADDGQTAVRKYLEAVIGGADVGTAGSELPPGGVYVTARPKEPLSEDTVTALRHRLSSGVDRTRTWAAAPRPVDVVVTPEYLLLYCRPNTAAPVANAGDVLKRLLSEARLPTDRPTVPAGVTDPRFWSEREAGTLAALDDAHRDAVRDRADARYGDASAPNGGTA
jgi:hypothetical protein